MRQIKRSLKTTGLPQPIKGLTLESEQQNVTSSDFQEQDTIRQEKIEARRQKKAITSTNKIRVLLFELEKIGVLKS